MKAIIGGFSFFISFVFAVEASNTTSPTAFALSAVFLAAALFCAFNRKEEEL